MATRKPTRTPQRCTRTRIQDHRRCQIVLVVVVRVSSAPDIGAKAVGHYNFRNTVWAPASLAGFSYGRQQCCLSSVLARLAASQQAQHASTAQLASYYDHSNPLSTYAFAAFRVAAHRVADQGCLQLCHPSHWKTALHVRKGIPRAASATGDRGLLCSWTPQAVGYTQRVLRCRKNDRQTRDMSVGY